MPQKVSVLGAGNGGYTLAFHLAHLGNEVILYEHPDFAGAIAPVQKANGTITALETADGFRGVISGDAQLKGATSDIKEAIEFADIVMVIVPAFGQLPIFQLALPHVRDGQIFMMLPGNFSSLAFAKFMKEKGSSAKLTFVETDSIPYACRRVQENQIFISGIKKYLTTGVFPGKDTAATIEKLQPLFTLKLCPGKTVLEAGFSNMNMVIHPPPSLFNAGWIESRNGDFSFYRDGASKSVCNYVDALDKERMEVAAAMGLSVKSCPEIFCGWYGLDYSTSFESFHNSPYHGFFKGPPSLNNRYVQEDTAYLLMPIARHLAPKFGIKTPAIEALVTVAEILTGQKLEPQREFSIILKDGDSVADLHEKLKEGV